MFSIPDPMTFIILCLATFRFSRLLTVDVILSSLREKIWNKFPPHVSKFGYLFTCSWCMSIWVASAVTLCYTIIPIVTLLLCVPFAISAVVGLIANRLDN